ncbi:nucleoside-diphosphate-sugar epimerase family protein [Trichodelitschia bisporula]|uniref:Nucleoside-diphosphate-sugar epimerase family protein n=1 Tax=Trichodelitschia bisporula TaxID=703511 RepID=A0A6G1HI52_9PEZI|nr:nucleoside-diphosphate-sugar epimerase family protein [Trichodelitschia bisporula]
MSKVALITGATGKQGGAVVSALLGAKAPGYTILGLTRNPESASAQKLVAKGVKLVKGDMSDSAAIFEEAKKVVSEPIWGVFSVQMPPMGKSGATQIEENLGKALIDAALANGVKVFVQTSVDRHGEKSIDNPTDVPHFISKHNIEKYLIEKAGDKMSWTILRPVAFMDSQNSTPDFGGKAFHTAWRTQVKDKPLQLVAVKDIGWFGAQALLHSDEDAYKNKAISLAGDELTFEQANETLKKFTGTDLPQTYGFVTSALSWAIKDLGLMFRWFYNEGYAANIPELKKLHPGLLNFEQFLEQESKYTAKP